MDGWVCRRCGGTKQYKASGGCVVCAKAYRQIYEKTHKRRARKFFRQYGITVQQREEIYISQNKSCAICKISYEITKLHTDHDHTSGAVRGLLCPNCNHALGMFNDDPVLLAEAISYVESAPKIRSELPAHTKLISASSFYESKKSCRLCGGTKRYKSNRNCVPCYKRKQKMRRLDNAQS
jgi:hypothetical protein